MNNQTKSTLNDFVKKAAQRLQDKKVRKTRQLYVKSIDETITIRNLSEAEILECQEMNTDNSGRGDKYSVYLGVIEPDLKQVAQELIKAGEIKEPCEAANIFDIGEITEIAVEILDISGIGKGGVTRVETIKN